MSGMPEVLTVDSASVGFGDRTLLKDLSFTLHGGDVLAVLGANGTGKTTLLKAVLGIIPVASGNIRLFGMDVRKRRNDESSVAYIPQRMDFDRTFPISLREMLDLSRRDAQIEKYIDMLELRPLLNKSVGVLSGGQFQRALLTYAVLKEPRLLVMDEPTSWVDEKGIDCVLCMIEEFKRKGIAVLVVSHDYAELSGIATRVLGLSASGQWFLKTADEPGLADALRVLIRGHAGHDAPGHCRMFFKGL